MLTPHTACTRNGGVVRIRIAKRAIVNCPGRETAHGGRFGAGVILIAGPPPPVPAGGSEPTIGRGRKPGREGDGEGGSLRRGSISGLSGSGIIDVMSTPRVEVWGGEEGVRGARHVCVWGWSERCWRAAERAGGERGGAGRADWARRRRGGAARHCTGRCSATGCAPISRVAWGGPAHAAEVAGTPASAACGMAESVLARDAARRARQPPFSIRQHNKARPGKELAAARKCAVETGRGLTE
eukprot:scaffold2000_cov86-Isochrysis_galbana.AAC.3